MEAADKKQLVGPFYNLISRPSQLLGSSQQVWGNPRWAVHPLLWLPWPGEGETGSASCELLGLSVREKAQGAWEGP